VNSLRLAVLATTVVGVLLALGAVLVLSHDRSDESSTPVSTVVTTSERTRTLVSKVRERLDLNGDIETGCVTADLDSRPDLVVGLGDSPADSVRFSDLTALSESCKRQAKGGDAVLDRIRSSPGVQVDAVKEHCVLRSLVAYKSAELERLRAPADGSDALERRLHELLVICGAVTPT
jgi:hypothetical protein